VAIDAEVPVVGRWIIVTPPNGLPGLALVVAREGSVEEKRIGQMPLPTISPIARPSLPWPARAVGGDYYDFLDLGNGPAS
jgi:hypothetical protein